jgi:PAS domain S-box-containing protein
LRDITRKSLLEETKNIGEVKSEFFRQYLRNTKIHLREIGENLRHDKKIQSLSSPSKKIQNDIQKEIERDMKLYLKNIPEFSGIFLTDEKGKVLFSIQKHNNYKNEAFDTNGFPKEKIFLDDLFTPGLFTKMKKDVFVLQQDKKNSSFIIMGEAIYDEEEFVGILGTHINMNFVNNIIKNTKGIGESGRTYIVGQDGFFRSDPTFMNPKNFLQKKQLEKMKKECFHKNTEENTVHNPNFLAEKSIISSYIYIPEVDWCLVSEIDELEAFHALDDFRNAMFIGAGFCFLFVFLVVSFIARRLLFPLSLLTEKVRHFGKGELSTRVHLQKMANDEVFFLAREFNKMANSLQEFTGKIEQKVKEQTKIITQQKQVAEQLALERRKFYLSVKNSSEHTVILNPDLTILYANKAVEKHTGYGIKEINGKHIDQAWRRRIHNKKYQKIWRDMKKIQHPCSLEVTNIRKDRTEYIAEMNVTPIFFDEKKNGKNTLHFIVMTENDITRRREVENMKNEFIDIASHELRTPMTLIRGYASIALKYSSEEVPSPVKKYISIILKNTERLIAMINNMLDISKIESGESPEKKGDIHLENFLEEIKKDFTPVFQEKSCTLEINVQHKNAIAFYSRNELKRVCTNLIGNAIKFIPQKSGKVTLRVKSYNKTFWKISIEDNGPGIGKEDQKHIFKKFGMVGSSLHHTTGGTGLGLVICKSIIEKNKGKIWFETHTNGGSIFIFTLSKKIPK